VTTPDFFLRFFVSCSHWISLAMKKTGEQLFVQSHTTDT